jgi:hypothetical protein
LDDSELEDDDSEETRFSRVFGTARSEMLVLTRVGSTRRCAGLSGRTLVLEEGSLAK